MACQRVVRSGLVRLLQRRARRPRQTHAPQKHQIGHHQRGQQGRAHEVPSNDVALEQQHLDPAQQRRVIGHAGNAPAGGYAHEQGEHKAPMHQHRGQVGTLPRCSGLHVDFSNELFGPEAPHRENLSTMFLNDTSPLALQETRIEPSPCRPCNINASLPQAMVSKRSWTSSRSKCINAPLFVGAEVDVLCRVSHSALDWRGHGSRSRRERHRDRHRQHHHPAGWQERLRRGGTHGHEAVLRCAERQRWHRRSQDRHAHPRRQQQRGNGRSQCSQAGAGWRLLVLRPGRGRAIHGGDEGSLRA